MVSVVNNDDNCRKEKLTMSECETGGAITAKNTVISPNLMVWKFCGKAQFPHSFGRCYRGIMWQFIEHRF